MLTQNIQYIINAFTLTQTSKEKYDKLIIFFFINMRRSDNILDNYHIFVMNCILKPQLPTFTKRNNAIALVQSFDYSLLIFDSKHLKFSTMTVKDHFFPKQFGYINKDTFAPKTSITCSMHMNDFYLRSKQHPSEKLKESPT